MSSASAYVLAYLLLIWHLTQSNLPPPNFAEMRAAGTPRYYDRIPLETDPPFPQWFPSFFSGSW